MNYESKLQLARNKNGNKWEDKILLMSSSKWENCDLTLDDLETTKTWNCDLVNHEDKIFLELTTSVKDAKEAKSIIESKVHKHHYPDYKFVMGIKKISKKGKRLDGLNSHIDHLNQTSTIDQVLIGEEEVLKFMRKPFYNKQVTINNKKQGVTMKSNILIQDTILRGIDLGNINAVHKLVKMFSGETVKQKIVSKSGNKDAQKVKKEYFFDNIISGIKSENTQSIATINEEVLGVEKNNQRSLDRFFSSKLATSMKDAGVKMIDTGVGTNPDRYHFRLSDVEQYVS